MLAFSVGGFQDAIGNIGLKMLKYLRLICTQVILEPITMNGIIQGQGIECEVYKGQNSLRITKMLRKGDFQER